MGTSAKRIVGESGLVAGGGGMVRGLLGYAGRDGIPAAALVAAGALLEGVGLALLVPLLAVVVAAGAPAGRLERTAAAVLGYVGAETPAARIAVILAAFGVVVALRTAVIAARDVRVAALQIGFAEALRLRLAGRLAAASWGELVRLRHARVTQLMSAEIQSVGAAASILLRLAVAVAMLAAQAALLLMLAPLLTLTVLAVLGLASLVFVPLLGGAYAIGGAVVGGNLSLLDSTAQFLGGLKLAIGQNLQSGFLAEFGATVAKLRARQIAFTRRQARARAVFTLVTTFAAALTLVAGVGLFHASSATLIALILVVARMSGPTVTILQGAQQLARLLPAYESLCALEAELAALAPAPARAPPRPAAAPEGPIVFEAVSYRHGDDDAGEGRGVDALDLVIAPREFVGVTGPSGAGKTTFADLVAGLLQPQHGRVAVGGASLDGEALVAWRTAIAYVAQDAFLFHDSIRRNLAWMAPEASEAEMWRALAVADAADLVRRMERGLDTMVGERGSLVSGGERQRLALARAVLRKPRVLILDEATSAIDAAGERAIVARLLTLAPRPTIVLVAHRAESLALCDRLLTFEGGRLVADRRV
jgi:ATP-binding cassette subfamily C protein